MTEEINSLALVLGIVLGFEVAVFLMAWRGLFGFSIVRKKKHEEV